MRSNQEIEIIKKKFYPVFKHLAIIHLALLWLVPKHYREIFIEALETQNNFIKDIESQLDEKDITQVAGKNRKKPVKHLKNIFLSEFAGSAEIVLRCNILFEHTYNLNFTCPNTMATSRMLQESMKNIEHRLDRQNTEQIIHNVCAQRLAAVLNIESQGNFFERHKDKIYILSLLLAGCYLAINAFNGIGRVNPNDSFFNNFFSRIAILGFLCFLINYTQGSFRLSTKGRDLWMKAGIPHNHVHFSTGPNHHDINAILTTTSISPTVEVELLRMFERSFAKFKIKPQVASTSTATDRKLTLEEKKPAIEHPAAIARSSNFFTVPLNDNKHSKRLPKIALKDLDKLHYETNDHLKLRKKTMPIEWNLPSSTSDSTNKVVYDLDKGIFLDDHSAELKPGRLVRDGQTTPWFVWLNMNKLAKEIPEETLNKFRLLLLQYQIVSKGNGYWYVSPNSPVILGKEKITLNTPFGFVVKSFKNYQNQKNVRVLVTPIAETKSLYLCSNTRVGFHG